MISGEEQHDQELWHRAVTAGESDLRPFEVLVNRHHRHIVANCRYLTRDAGSAEDLAQEVFVKAFFGLNSFQGRSSFRHWLQGIKVHHCLNYIRKRAASREKVSIDEAAPEVFESLRVPPNAEREMEASDDRGRIARTLESLPSTLRLPLVMRDMDDLSYEEIAASLGIGLSAVKMRIKRGREAFRRQYQASAEMASAGGQSV